MGSPTWQSIAEVDIPFLIYDKRNDYTYQYKIVLIFHFIKASYRKIAEISPRKRQNRGS